MYIHICNIYFNYTYIYTYNIIIYHKKKIYIYIYIFIISLSLSIAIPKVFAKAEGELLAQTKEPQLRTVMYKHAMKTDNNDIIIRVQKEGIQSSLGAGLLQTHGYRVDLFSAGQWIRPNRSWNLTHSNYPTKLTQNWASDPQTFNTFIWLSDYQSSAFTEY